jgi:hypothetical protein
MSQVTATMTTPAECDKAEFVAVVACDAREERVTGPAKDALRKLGCGHFIETDIFNAETGKMITRIDGYKIIV